MNKEKFKLWKLALGSIHTDGKVTKEELDWFKSTITFLKTNKLLDFNDEQIQQLNQTLATPANNFLLEFEKLQNPADCSILLHLIRTISHLDKDFHKKEQSLYLDLEKACLKNVDLKLIENEINKMEKQSYHEDEVYKVHNQHSYFERAFKSILRILNPGD